MANQIDQVPGPCHLFQKFGSCPYGITCMFRGGHATPSTISSSPSVSMSTSLSPSFPPTSTSAELQSSSLSTPSPIIPTALSSFQTESLENSSKCDRNIDLTSNLCSITTTNTIITENNIKNVAETNKDIATENKTENLTGNKTILDEISDTNVENKKTSACLNQVYHSAYGVLNKVI